MNAPAQDIGGGGKLWDAMRRAGSCVTQEIAFWYGSVMAYGMWYNMRHGKLPE